MRTLLDMVVLEKRNDEATMTDSGLHLVTSDTNKPDTMIADVVTVGPDVKDVKVGDTVIVEYYAGAEYEGKIFVHEEVILATISE